MANLWVTGDSWGVLDKQLPHTHWVNFYAEKYKLDNIYCLARAGISQDMINYMTHCVVKNVEWEGRTQRWSNYDDHLIVFPTSPTRITFNKIWDKETFNVQLGPHNLNWEGGVPLETQPHPWYTDNRHANLESENYTSLNECDNVNRDIVRSFGQVHPCSFNEWRDMNHLNHILRELQNCRVYSSTKCPDANDLLGEKCLHNHWPADNKEQINHLCKDRHLAYWKKLKPLL